jgi:AraC-like DNA-binding protein
MFLAGGPLGPSAASSGHTSLSVLVCHGQRLTTWNHPDLRAPYWRLYWNESPGASVAFSGRTTPLRPDRFLLIPPETSFATANGKPVRHFYAHFVTSPRWRLPGIFSLPADPQATATLQGCAAAADSGGWSLPALIAKLLAQLPVEGWAAPIDPSSRARAAMRQIETQTPAPIVVSALAKQTGMHPSAFGRHFTREAGISPARYARERRLETACHYLHHTDLSIEEIAAACGFCDRYHFTRVFAKYRGVPPATFRRQLQE